MASGAPGCRSTYRGSMSRPATTLLVFGCYLLGLAARADLRRFIAWSVPLRLSVPVFFGAFVAAGLVSPVLMLFAAVDVAAALWTWTALRREPT